ncbi:hypothetical protein P8452_41397 [Trifolium repens]|nr:hypothetical protein P8452_41397 [Trifolium repens]
MRQCQWVVYTSELPLNIRRKDPRKTMNIYVDCHGSGDEEASCRDCKCRKKIMSTAGNPDWTYVCIIYFGRNINQNTTFERRPKVAYMEVLR